MQHLLYDDILYLPHHRSLTHPHMSGHSRAAQFAPFAALSGYEDAISETARLTERRPVLTEEERDALDVRLQILMELATERPEITVTWFIPDERKEGGAIDRTTGTVRRVDPYEALLYFTDGRTLPLQNICAVSSQIFHHLLPSAEH